MSTIKFKKSIVFASVLLLQPVLDLSSAAHARKRTPPKAYSFIAEGGKASQAECDGERKLPRLKRLKEFNKYSSYMGSELQSPEIKGKAGEEMWKHIFRAKDVCNTVLAKTPSSVQDPALKDTKPELPPDDSIETEDEGDNNETKTESPDPADAADKPEKADKANGADSE